MLFIAYNSTVHLSSEVCVPLQFSYGICMAEKLDDYQGMIKLADERMYENKRERKSNKVANIR